MPGNPKECRLHALECARLAQTSATQEDREHFAQLARTWLKLAEDIEQSQAFIAGLDEFLPGDEQPA
jgi:hypothetical protein